VCEGDVRRKMKEGKRREEERKRQLQNGKWKEGGK
jgi:hypothetical protein